MSNQQVVLQYFALQLPVLLKIANSYANVLAQPSQHKEAQQTNIHFRSGI
jgi:hypothetical protein